MSRPTKSRRLCRMPSTVRFVPADNDGGEGVTLNLDEFEAIRLIDKEGLSQEDCSLQMCISRTTVQKIYEAARKKLADALVDGLPLTIGGGEVSLCDGRHASCINGSCRKREIKDRYYIQKGENTMRIAVTYENGMIFGHFGHTEQFKVYDIEDGEVKESRVVSTNGQGHGALAELLSALGADILICGGIGGGAQMALLAEGINIYGGCSGSADAAVNALIHGTLDYDPNVKCSHHENEHGGEAHSCGSHGCGKGSCGH